MRRYENLRRIQRLDPRRDYEEIYRLMVFREFPWDLRLAGKAMIWHLFAVPSTAEVVGATDALLGRAELTALLFGDLIEHGLHSTVGRGEISFTNRSHRGWTITDEEHTYALCALSVTALRWLDRYGWRQPSRNERIAVTEFYAELGRLMGVADVPRDPAEAEEYVVWWEAARVEFSPVGRLVSDRTVAMAAGRVWWLRPLVRPVVAAVLDPRIRAAVGLPAPPRWFVTVLKGGFWVRGRLVRWLPPRRRDTTPRTRRGLAPASAEPDERTDVGRIHREELSARR